MWDSPSWIGPWMSAKVKQESDAAARALTSTVEANKIQAQKEIETMRLQTQRDINTASLETQANIAEERVKADKAIAEERNRVNKEIALWQTLGNVAPKILPIALGAKVLDDKSSNNNNTLNTNGQSRVAGSEISSKEEARKKADELFPNVEPTFELKPLNSKVTKFGINTAMAGAVVALLSSMPVLGL